MPISLGTTTITALFLGTTSITSAYLGSTQVFGGSFSPLSLFSSGSQGIWLDPSDLSTMFSDRAGTTPVTTPGTVVGLRLDKSKGGVGTNGASRRNLLTWTEDFGNAVWVKRGFAAPTTGETDPLGGSTAVSFLENNTDANPAIYHNAVIPTAAVTVGVWLRASSATSINLSTNGNTTNGSVPVTTTWQFFSQTQTTATPILGPHVGGFGSVTRASGIRIYVWRPQLELGSTASAYQKITSDWASTMAGNHAVAPTDAARPIYGVEPKGGRRNLLLATDTLATQSLTVTAVAHTLAFTGTGTVTLTGASTAGPLVGTGAGNRVSLTFTPTAASLTLTVSGSVTLGQLELGSSATAYQKVVTAENVTEAGVPTCHYCRYDGANNSMSTSAIDFTATDKMSVFAGVRKLSDAAQGMLVEFSTNVTANNGVINLYTFTTPSNVFTSKGTVMREPLASSAPAPLSMVMTGLGDISGDTATLRINGTQVAQATGDQGTGNYGNYPMFFGRRNNASFPFNGRDYGIVVVGKAASAGEITDTETWLAAKTAQVTL